jgi:copper chaperone CopZ
MMFFFPSFQTWFLKVSIHCEGCRKKVKKVLKRIDGTFTTISTITSNCMFKFREFDKISVLVVSYILKLQQNLN